MKDYVEDLNKYTDYSLVLCMYATKGEPGNKASAYQVIWDKNFDKYGSVLTETHSAVEDD